MRKLIFPLLAVLSILASAFSQTESVIHSFQGSPDGSVASSSVAYDGFAYFGMAAQGGCLTNDCGVLYRFRPPQTNGRWTGATLHTFNPGDDPAGDLLFTGEEIWGVTRSGGGFGQVYQSFARGSKFHILHSFNQVEGSQPNGDLNFVFVNNPSVVGTTSNGGSGNAGVVFSLVLRGNWTYNSVYTFTGGADGGHPAAGLAFDASRNGYGTTTTGGSGKAGTIYKITLPPNGSTLKTLYSFTGGQDGAFPSGRLLLAADGSLYGTAQFGGDPTCNCGTVFKLTPSGNSWTLTTLYAFLGGADGANPQSALIFDSTGAIFGTTANGGACGLTNGCGTIFRLTPAGDAWTESIYYTFLGGTDGQNPVGAPVIVNGVLYGATSGGGALGLGTFFQVAP